LLCGQALLVVAVLLGARAGLVRSSLLVVIIIVNTFLLASALRVALALTAALHAGRVGASGDSMNWAGVHTPIDKQRLLQPDQRKLLLQGLGDAFDFYAACILTRGVTILWRRELLKRSVMRLLMALVDVLLDIGFRLKLLLLIIHLWTVELVVLVIRQEYVLITRLPASCARLEEPVLLLNLVDAIDLLSDDAVLTHAVVVGVVVCVATVLHVLAADNIILLMRLVH
jgi:hypothetical protein